MAIKGLIRESNSKLKLNENKKKYNKDEVERIQVRGLEDHIEII